MLADPLGLNSSAPFLRLAVGTRPRIHPPESSDPGGFAVSTRVDHSGKVFGRLTAVSSAGSTSARVAKWVCHCSCGSVLEVRSSDLVSGNTKSCGCLHRDRTRSKNTRHGETSGRNVSPEYLAWLSMRVRTTNTSAPGAKDYALRGITVCPSWENSFKQFLDDMGRKPSQKHSLDRVDNSLGYSKENCRWATASEQNRNKRNNVIVVYQDKCVKLVDLVDMLGLTKAQAKLIRGRLRRGWSHEAAIIIK
jgi:hypothetical protein